MNFKHNNETEKGKKLPFMIASSNVQREYDIDMLGKLHSNLQTARRGYGNN